VSKQVSEHLIVARHGATMVYRATIDLVSTVSL
jgi:hypothetical protein